MKDRSKQLLVIGVVGCLLYVIGDFLYAATGQGQTTETIGMFLKVAYLDMTTWRMVASILCGFVGTLLPWPLNQLDHGTESFVHALVLLLGLILLREMQQTDNVNGHHPAR